MKRVLVADDKATGRELIRTVLEQCGHSVFEAGDGIEAVRRARELLPDLIILDLHMPELDGFGAFREIRADERFAATPIIALTASAMHGRPRTGIIRGFHQLPGQAHRPERSARRGGASAGPWGLLCRQLLKAHWRKKPGSGFAARHRRQSGQRGTGLGRCGPAGPRDSYGVRP